MKDRNIPNLQDVSGGESNYFNLDYQRSDQINFLYDELMKDDRHIGMKLPTECARCKDSFHSPDVSTQRWFWMETESGSFYVCDPCLTPNERLEFTTDVTQTFII